MITLSPDECRVLGVLVEKALTTPAQYPLTLNALVNGCNQKSNRHPVVSLDEDDVLAALDGLRSRDMAREVLLSGSRVAKFRHNAREVLGLDTPAVVLLAELMLRGPQTTGELRGRASRMHAMDSIEAVERELQVLMERDPPLVRQLPPAPGTRAARYVQLLCPDLHPLDAAPQAHTPTAPTAAAALHEPGLAARVEALETEVAQLKEIVERLAAT